MYLRVGINGFGRIGRIVLRACLQNPDLQVAAINDPALDVEYICYLIKFDSTHGKLEGSIVQRKNEIIINDDIIIRVYNEKSPPEIPWHLAGVNYVVESSGMFTTMEKASGHLINECVKQVIVTAPSIDIPMIILGVNDEKLTTDIKIVSAGSSTLYCLAPIIKILEDNFGVTEGFVTSIHAMTPSMKPLDGLCLRGKHWRDHRSAVQNIIPAATGACKALGKIVPQAKDKLTGLAFRVPIVNVSVLDLTVKLATPTSLENIAKDVELAGQTCMKNIVKVSNDEAVSSDFMKDSHSCILDLDASLQLRPTSYKLICWYENEYSYACRVLDYMILNEKKAIFSSRVVDSCCSKISKFDSKCSFSQCFKGDAKGNLTVLANKMSIYCMPEVAQNKLIRQRLSMEDTVKKNVMLQAKIYSKPMTNKWQETRQNETAQFLKKTKSFSSSWNKKRDSLPSWPDSKEPKKNFYDFGSKYTQNLDSVRPHQEDIEKIKQHFNKVADITEALMKKSCSHKFQSTSKTSENDFNAIVAKSAIKAPVGASSLSNATYITESSGITAKQDVFKKFKSENDVIHKKIPEIVDDSKTKVVEEMTDIVEEESKVLCITNFDSIEPVQDPIRISPLKNAVKQELIAVKESETEKNSIMKISENENYCTESISSESYKQDANVTLETDMKTLKDCNAQKIFKKEEDKTTDKSLEIIHNDQELPVISDSPPGVLDGENSSKFLLKNNNSLFSAIKADHIVDNNEDTRFKNINLDNCPFLDMKTKNVDAEVALPDESINTDTSNLKIDNLIDNAHGNISLLPLNNFSQEDIHLAGPSNLHVFPKLENTDPSQRPSMQFTPFSSKADVLDEKPDIYDKLDSKSVSDASENSFQINEKTSQIIKLTDVSRSLEDLDRLDKICRIIEISDDLSDQLFSTFDKDISDANVGNMWSFNEMCKKIKLEEFYDKRFGGNTGPS